MAAARKVSPAASITLRPSAENFAASLPIVVVLPEPLTPTTRMTNGFCAASIYQRLCHRRQHLFDFGRNHGLHLIGRNRLVVAPRADGIRDARRDFGAEIGAQQHILDIVEHGAVELALGDEVGDRGPERTRGSLQAAGQPLPPAPFGCFCSGIVHGGDVLAVSPRKRKSRRLTRCSRIDRRRNPGPRAPSRRPDAGHRQAGRAAGASRPRRRAQSGGFVRERCGLACRGRRCWPTGWTKTPPAASCLVGIARRPPRSVCCSSMARFQKTYWAVVEGGPAEDEGTIDLPLGRKNAERGWWQKPDPEGQKAVTNWKVLGRGEGLALACDGTGHRTDPSIARACFCHGFSDRRR